MAVHDDLAAKVGEQVHELGNVLTALFGTVDVMRLSAHELPPELADDVERLSELCRRAGVLNGDLLALSRALSEREARGST